MVNDISKYRFLKINSMEGIEYWKRRCELAEDYVNKSPCDPDITDEQFIAYERWEEFKKLNLINVINSKTKHMENASKEQLIEYKETVVRLKEEEVITNSEYKRIIYRINQKLNWLVV